MKLSVYTDGGCTGNKRGAGCPGAWGFVLVDPAGNVVGQGDARMVNTTNNRMEQMAVIHGLRGAKIYFDQYMNGAKANDCIVVSDSKYIVDNFDSIPEWKENGWRRSGNSPVINADLWKEIYAFTPEFKSLSFRWVKGHSTNKYNQMADDLVRGHLQPTT